MVVVHFSFLLNIENIILNFNVLSVFFDVDVSR